MLKGIRWMSLVGVAVFSLMGGMSCGVGAEEGDAEVTMSTETDIDTATQAIGSGKCDGKTGCKLYTDHIVDNARCRNRINYTYICKSRLGAITCTDAWNTPWKPGC